MSTLKELQQQFQAYLHDEDVRLLDRIEIPPLGDKQQRAAIYKNAYLIRITDLLAQHFAKLEQLLGKNLFAGMVKQYVHDYPPQHFSVFHLGEHLPQFLQDSEGVDPLWPELARFEWAIASSLNSAEAKVLTEHGIQQLDDQALLQSKFSFHPSVTIEQFTLNVSEVWLALQQGDAYECKALQELQSVLFWQQRGESYFQVLQPIDVLLCEQIQQGISLHEVVAKRDDLMAWVIDRVRLFLQQGILYAY